ncbi:MAG: hypothetical protein ABL974_08105 [Prosthecobacter sp.]
MKATHALLALLTSMLLTQCMMPSAADYAPPPAGATMATRSSLASPMSATESRTREIALKERPGLGTQLGHQIHQDTTHTHFYRRNSSVPDATASFHYNDEEGAKLMARLHGASFKHGGSFDLVPGKLRVMVRPLNRWESGVRHYNAEGRIIVIGRPSLEYQIILTNLTRHRLEIVTSVDGLDVLTGRAASASGSGYIIAEKSSISIPGMRVGGVLRAFQFSSVADSRAATAFGAKGARNVGVIGVALYEEDEIARRRVRVEENYVRDGARAFGN